MLPWIYIQVGIEGNAMVLHVGVILLTTIIINIAVKLILRRLLSIKKERLKIFSHNYFNKLHRNIDRVVRYMSLITQIVLLYYVIFHDSFIRILFGSIIFFFILQSLIQAIFEWKYSPTPKKSILTFSEMIIWTVGFISIFRVLLQSL